MSGSDLPTGDNSPGEDQELPGLEDADLSYVDYESWSDLEWAAWFRDEVIPTGGRPWEFWYITGEVDESLNEAIRAMERARDSVDLADWVMSFFGRRRAKLTWDQAFARLPLHLKLKFLEGWYLRQTGLIDADSDDSRSGEETSVNITLPGGGVIAVPVERPPEANGGGMSEWIDELDPAETTDKSEPPEPAETESIVEDMGIEGVGWQYAVGRIGRNIRRPVITGVAVVSVVVLGFVLFTGGDSEEAVPGVGGVAVDSDQGAADQAEQSEPEPPSSASLNLSFTDDLGDFVEREPFEPDPNPDPAADIVGVSLRTAGEATVITLDFAAPGENHPGLGLDARITPSDGPIINMLRRPDGSAKVSDPPNGETLTAKWVDADSLELTLGNWTPDGEFELAVSTLISSQGMYTIDEWVGQLVP